VASAALLFDPDHHDAATSKAAHKRGPMSNARRPDDPPLHFEAHLFVCCNRRPDGHKRGSCAEKGSEALRDYMKVRAKEMGLPGVRVNMAGCLDRCERGPCLVIYPEGVWYRIGSPQDVDAVLERHVRDGGRVPGLMLPAD
jgi:(2Fe-2S) ferredoxin